ncbi:MAG: PHP domain-containing protein, partial [Clostridia bacterium]|nr:PHP domain-containing protein [Clostridia bacterium]
KKVLIELERNIAEFYELETVRFKPHYPSELLTKECIPEIIEEAKRSGVAVRGFFNSYDFTLTDDKLRIEIPYESAAHVIIDLAKTEELISSIIRDEFSRDITVDVAYSRIDTGLESYLAARGEIEKNTYAAETKRALEEAAERRAAELEAGEADEREKRVSLFDLPDKATLTEDGCVTSGRCTFDISSPSLLLGKEFAIKDPVPLRLLVKSYQSVVFLGELFKFEERELRGGDRFSVTLGVTDRDSSVYVRKVIPAEELPDWKKKFRVASCIAVRGSVKPDKYDGEFNVSPQDILLVKKVKRKDTAQEKRVELHLHTNMSEADALIKPEDAVTTACEWGHPAVAITDHGNLQSFPVAMLTAEALAKEGRDIKVIYGVEDYFVDDTARAVYGDYKGTFDAEFIVFDIETTGLSVQGDRITEIGAVKVKNGEIIERYDTFVDPEMEIPEHIIQLTGITNEMVRSARKIGEVLPEFFEFIGDRLLIAHNANFDTSFIRRAAERLKIPFDNPYLDTVAMSHYVNPDLAKHKLDSLAKYYDLGDFNHHRACDDAEMLALIFLR